MGIAYIAPYRTLWDRGAGSLFGSIKIALKRAKIGCFCVNFNYWDRCKIAIGSVFV